MGFPAAQHIHQVVGRRTRWLAGDRERPKPRRVQDLARGTLRELVDEAGTPILYTSGTHVYEQAQACVTFDEQRWLRFPVRGTERANAIMTAVDQAGQKIARYRLLGGQRRWNRAEITIHPVQQLTDELVLAIAISAPWLSSCFSSPAPGGGGDDPATAGSAVHRSRAKLPLCHPCDHERTIARSIKVRQPRELHRPYVTATALAANAAPIGTARSC
jgi:hypothetical protein